MLATNQQGTPIRIGDVATVSIGGNIRRGVVDVDGEGEAVGAVVVMRSGENALNIIKRVKGKHARRAARPRGQAGSHDLQRADWLLDVSVQPHRAALG